MTYCISDIHGEILKWKDMLELIQFSDEDTLYVLGDVIDRNPHGIEILREIMQRSNIHMIVGNHEDMMLKTLGRHNTMPDGSGSRMAGEAHTGKWYTGSPRKSETRSFSMLQDSRTIWRLRSTARVSI